MKTDRHTMKTATPDHALSTPAVSIDARGGLALAGITKRYADGLTAVDNIGLQIEAGTYCCLLGPSGCGKTTMLRMIAGHETPSAGTILIDGKNVAGQSPSERGTAMMFQNYALFPHLSVRDNVAFAMRTRGIDRKTRLYEADKVIEQVQLAALADRMPGQLSGGQQQRVALARAIIMRPKVLLLDEPLSALDEFLRLQMRGELRSMQRMLGITFVHVTHTQLEAIAVADQVVVMERGRIAQSAPPHEIYARPQTAYVAHFIGGQNVLRGTVAGTVGRTAMLTGAQAGSFVVNTRAPVSEGEVLAFAVRRDRVAVTPLKPQLALGSNEARGTVRELEYQGLYMKVTVALHEDDAPPFVAFVEERAFFGQPVAVGQDVNCSWASEEALGLEA
jgi:putative spermidine/putrescine transport system ATP-binding protein